MYLHFNPGTSSTTEQRHTNSLGHHQATARPNFLGRLNPEASSRPTDTTGTTDDDAIPPWASTISTTALPHPPTQPNLLNVLSAVTTQPVSSTTTRFNASFFDPPNNVNNNYTGTSRSRQQHPTSTAQATGTTSSIRQDMSAILQGQGTANDNNSTTLVNQVIRAIIPAISSATNSIQVQQNTIPLSRPHLVPQQRQLCPVNKT